MPLLTLESVSKSYGALKVTDDISLSALRDRVDVLAQRFPLYPNLTETPL